MAGSRSGTSLSDSFSRIRLGPGADPRVRFSMMAEKVRKSAAYKAAFRERAAKDLSPDEFDEGIFTDRYLSTFEIDIANDDEGFGINENGNSDDGDEDDDLSS
jgi:hypothetical protein